MLVAARSMLLAGEACAKALQQYPAWSHEGNAGSVCFWGRVNQRKLGVRSEREWAPNQVRALSTTGWPWVVVYSGRKQPPMALNDRACCIFSKDRSGVQY